MFNRKTQVLALVSILTLGIGVASALGAGSKTTVTVCVAKSTGAVRVISNTTCKPLVETKQVWEISGTQGPAGAQGSQGATGDRGAQGLQGIQGLPGAKGDKGDSGAQGLPGVAGEKGERGLPGLSYKDVVASVYDASAEFQRVIASPGKCFGPNWTISVSNNWYTCSLTVQSASEFSISKVEMSGEGSFPVSILAGECQSPQAVIAELNLFDGMDPFSIQVNGPMCFKFDRGERGPYSVNDPIAALNSMQMASTVSITYSATP